jgi:8-oxo-dGTP pyrophosphatase MutT (NUDIX family)
MSADWGASSDLASDAMLGATDSEDDCEERQTIDGRSLPGMTHRPQRYPVSVKGVVVRAGLVLLLRNERDEWELPGGKLELGEDPARCAEREIAEEAGWIVSAGPPIDAWQYHIADNSDVLVLTYGCYPATATGQPVLSPEHQEAGLFTQAAAAELRMPDGYKRSNCLLVPAAGISALSSPAGILRTAMGLTGVIIS